MKSVQESRALAAYDIRTEDRKAGAGVRIRGDRPLIRLSVWSIRNVMALNHLWKSPPSRERVPLEIHL
jgi:hypothetical protein